MSIFKPDLHRDRVALVTGGGSGIGRTIAEAFVEHGASVALLGRTQDKLDRASEQLSEQFGPGRARGFAADVRDPHTVERAVEAAVESFGGIDYVINAAAGNFLAPAASLSPKGFKTVVDIDCLGTFNTTRICFPQLMERGGVVVNITATQAWIPTPLQVHAGAAKAAIQKMTLDLALEWGPAGVRVVALAPGPIAETEGMRRLAPGDAGKRLLDTLPLRRFGKRREIAEAALFLCSEAAAYITGTTLVVDGGQALIGAGAVMSMLGT